MYRVVHIHNDIKFIDETSLFEFAEFHNEVVIFGEKGRYKGKYKDTAFYVKPSKSEIKYLVNHCKGADLVVLHNLCLYKSIIANLLDDDIKIAWRFFGYELYRYEVETFYSELTKDKLKNDSYSLHNLLKVQLRHLFKFRDFLKLKTTYNYEFVRAIGRINMFLGHYLDEYMYLKDRWPNLPRFVNLPALANFRAFSKLQEKEASIILGNSRNPLNNHFDILDIFLSSKNIEKYNLIIPFSYINESNYSMSVRDKVKLHSNILLMEEYITLDEYELLFKKASAFVMNAFRQAALGNILLALQNGVKTYLNQKNIVYSALNSQGLLVFSVDQFCVDLEKNNIQLSLDEMKHNISIMKKLAEENSLSSFHYNILNVLDQPR